MSNNISTFYTPFSKSLVDLEASDLTALREVSEGWYVEYKRQVPNIGSIAKSLSAFANQYGGWLFYGVEEKKDGTRVAGSFPGLSISELPEFELRIRNAAAHHVNPTPNFESRLVKGPSTELGLGAEKAVLVLHVPYGRNAPYIHSSGVIYRRVADESDPKRETDRATLDLLWERGRRDRNKLAQFFTQTPRRSRGENEGSYMQLFLMTNRFKDHGNSLRIDFDRFTTLMRDGDPESGGIPFDNMFTMSEGLMARQIANNDPYRQVLTWRYYRDFSTIVTIPFSSAPVGQIGAFLEGYNQTGKFLIACRHRKLNAGHVLDLNLLFHLLMGILCRHRILLTEEGFKGEVYAKACLENIWRRIPFLDTPGFVNFVSAHGIPLIQDEMAMVPPGTDPETLIELPVRNLEAPKKDGILSQLENAISIFIPLINALALPHNVFSDSRDSMKELFYLSDRARQVQERRSKV